jgi:hypothetical protein
MSRLSTSTATTPCKVIPFQDIRQFYANTPDTTPSFVWEVLSHPEFAARLKEEVESAVLEALLVERVKSTAKVDDPFDSIYISALQPDSIEPVDIAKLGRFANIVDLSQELEIADGWDD